MTPFNPYDEPCTGCEEREHELAELKEFVESVKEKGDALWVGLAAWAPERARNDLKDWQELFTDDF